MASTGPLTTSARISWAAKSSRRRKSSPVILSVANTWARWRSSSAFLISTGTRFQSSSCSRFATCPRTPCSSARTSMRDQSTDRASPMSREVFGTGEANSRSTCHSSRNETMSDRSDSGKRFLPHKPVVVYASLASVLCMKQIPTRLTRFQFQTITSGCRDLKDHRDSFNGPPVSTYQLKRLSETSHLINKSQKPRSRRKSLCHVKSGNYLKNTHLIMFLKSWLLGRLSIHNLVFRASL